MGMNKAHVPIRTCISCGTKKDKKALVRLVLDSSGLLIRDDQGKELGRGVYVCSEKSCWERLKKGNRLGKAFKRGSIAFHPNLGFK